MEPKHKEIFSKLNIFAHFQLFLKNDVITFFLTHPRVVEECVDDNWKVWVPHHRSFQVKWTNARPKYSISLRRRTSGTPLWKNDVITFFYTHPRVVEECVDYNWKFWVPQHRSF